MLKDKVPKWLNANIMLWMKNFQVQYSLVYESCQKPYFAHLTRKAPLPLFKACERFLRSSVMGWVGIICMQHSTLQLERRKSQEHRCSCLVWLAYTSSHQELWLSASLQLNVDDELQNVIGAWLLHSQWVCPATLPLQASKCFCHNSLLGILCIEGGIFSGSDL